MPNVIVRVTDETFARLWCQCPQENVEVADENCLWFLRKKSSTSCHNVFLLDGPEKYMIIVSPFYSSVLDDFISLTVEEFLAKISYPPTPERCLSFSTATLSTDLKTI
jgi:hypothetical protein